jgi:hypothetical protein
MDELTKNIIRVVHEWAMSKEDSKIYRWKNYRDERDIYMQIDDDKSFLFDKLESKEWPDLRQLGLRQLDRESYRVELVVKIISTLCNNDTAEALMQMKCPKVNYVMNSLPEGVRKDMDSRITLYSKRKLDNMRSDPDRQNEWFMATQEFVHSLPKTAWLCARDPESCWGTKNKLKAHSPFLLHKCMAYSFHPACGPWDDFCPLCTK